MSYDIQLLSMTPAPRARESLFGYVLRVSEANGYESPWQILGHAGLSQNKQLGPTMPSEPIARIVGYPAEDLKRLPWQHYPNGDPIPEQARGTWKLLRHIDFVSPKICPACVEKNGYVEAVWDLKIMLACPEHGTPLVQVCPTCKKPLTWYRPGLTVCRCKATISADTSSPISPRSVALLRIVHNVVYGIGTPLPDAKLLKMPLADLLPLHTNDLLSLIQRMRLFVVGEEKSAAIWAMRPYTTEELDAIASAFEDWPNGFHKLLRNMTPSQAGTSCAISLRKRYERIYQNLLKRKTQQPNCLDFIRKAFVEFGLSQGSGIYVDPRMTARVGIDDAASRIISSRALARRCGIDQRTIKALAANGLAREVTGTTADGETRKVYEIGDVVPIKDAGGSICTRKAAAVLSIPVSVLKGLRELGIYEVRHLGSRCSSYHQDDLEHMRSRIVEPIPRIAMATGPDRLSLEAIFRMKFRTSRGKADLVGAIFNETIKPLGRIGDRIPDIVICRPDVADFLKQDELPEDGMLPGAWAAKLLRCEVGTIVPLIEDGHLEGIVGTRYIRVTKSSLDSFSERYASSAWIAGLIGTNTRWVRNICASKSIGIIRATRKHTGVAQSFVARAGLSAFGITSLPSYYEIIK